MKKFFAGVLAAVAFIAFVAADNPYWDGLGVAKPYIYRDVDQTAIETATAAGVIPRITATNHTSDWVYLKVWDVRLTDLNTSTSTMLLDHPIPAGSGLQIDNLGIRTGMTIKVTAAIGATDTSDPGAAACNVHVWRKD